jgi:ribonuclease D
MSSLPLIAQPAALRELCHRLAQCDCVALDTEFIPEDTFTPQLCLVQIAFGEEVALIDPLAFADLQTLWRTVSRSGAELVVHAGKEELSFCHEAIGGLPERIFDVQLAAGLVGLGYPLSYGDLVRRLLNRSVQSTETRTDWRKRPLTHRQLEYAGDDARHLLALRARLAERLARLGRQAWLEEEVERLAAQVRGQSVGERWRRVAGIANFGPRQLAVVRQVAQWRELQAVELNKPAKRVMADHVIAELAKRQPHSLEELRNIRGIGRAGSTQWGNALVRLVRQAQALPDDECPRHLPRQRETPQEQMVVKILSAALLEVARRKEVAASLAASNQDLRELLQWHGAGRDPAQAPRLARGWRHDAFGEHLADILDGRIRMHIHNDANGPSVVFEDHVPAGRRANKDRKGE